MERVSKIAETIPKNSIYAAEVAKYCMNTWLLQYASPEELVPDNGGWLTSKFVHDVCCINSVDSNFKTAYHYQKNRQVESYNITTLAALRTYVGRKYRCLDLFTNALTYECSCQSHKSTSVQQFELLLSKRTWTTGLNLMLTSKDPRGEFKQKRN